jgi:hypothetical protein
MGIAANRVRISKAREIEIIRHKSADGVQKNRGPSVGTEDHASSTLWALLLQKAEFF